MIERDGEREERGRERVEKDICIESVKYIESGTHSEGERDMGKKEIDIHIQRDRDKDRDREREMHREREREQREISEKEK